MIEIFFQTYYKRNIVKGYKIIGQNLTYKFITVIFFLASIWLYILISNDWIALVILLRLFFYMQNIGDLMDLKLKNHEIKSAPRSKEYIQQYLTNNLKFNHSNQYKEFAILLKEHAESFKRSYNLLPYLAMTLPVVLFLSSLLVQFFPSHLSVIISITLAIFLLLIFLNPLVNGILNLLKNDKSKILGDLSNTVYEIFIEKSIVENQVQLIKQKSSKRR